MSLTSLPQTAQDQGQGLRPEPLENIDNFWKSKAYERGYNNIDWNKANAGYINQLVQLTRVVFDGDLISKSDRDKLYASGLIIRVEGWQVVSEKGIRYLHDLGIIKP